jgi:hypothetical protein
MSTLILIHIATGLAGSLAGLTAVAGMFYGRRMNLLNVVFLLMTAAACATGFVFLPSMGITSAQLVAFFVTFLLAIAGWARFAGQLEGSWNQVYAFAAVGAIFLNVLITTAQSFQHLRVLKALAPTQQSPVYVAVKIVLLLLFGILALLTARRAGRSRDIR